MHVFFHSWNCLVYAWDMSMLWLATESRDISVQDQEKIILSATTVADDHKKLVNGAYSKYLTLRGTCSSDTLCEVKFFLPGVYVFYLDDCE